METERVKRRIDVSVGDVNDVEAHLLAKYTESARSDSNNGDKVDLLGHVCGPYCETSKTLPAEFSFQQVGEGVARAVIPDPCQWSPELPHVYHVHVVAQRADELLAEYDGTIGLHRTKPRRTGIEFPG
jgi:hypothetical protein